MDEIELKRPTPCFCIIISSTSRIQFGATQSVGGGQISVPWTVTLGNWSATSKALLPISASFSNCSCRVPPSTVAGSKIDNVLSVLKDRTAEVRVVLERLQNSEAEMLGKHGAELLLVAGNVEGNISCDLILAPTRTVNHGRCFRR